MTAPSRAEARELAVEVLAGKRPSGLEAGGSELPEERVDSDGFAIGGLRACGGADRPSLLVRSGRTGFGHTVPSEVEDEPSPAKVKGGSEVSVTVGVAIDEFCRSAWKIAW